LDDSEQGQQNAVSRGHDGEAARLLSEAKVLDTQGNRI
jgi:hypothetical protein